MSKVYLVKWKAMEFYFFSGERNFGFGEGRNYNGNPYFIHSLKMPTQTTILGTLRYEILRRLNCESSYIDDEEELKQQQTELVGPQSFDLKGLENDFGLIKKMSPLFILKGEECIVKAPYHKAYSSATKYQTRDLKGDSERYDLLDGKNKRTLTLLNDISLKNESDHRSKFINLNKVKELESKEDLIDESTMFISDVRVGINTKATEDGFFKKGYCRLHPDYEFGVYVELDEYEELHKSISETGKSIVYMGMNKSAFIMTIEEVKDSVEVVENNVKETLKTTTNSNIYYALSDVYVDYEQLSKCCTLILGDCREFRNLKTADNPISYYYRFKAGSLHYMMSAGSVFFVENTEEFEKLFNVENLNKIGLNKVVNIGGK